MAGLITIVLTCTCTLCYVFQGLFGKMFSAHYEGESMDATAVFSTLFGGFVGVSVLAVALGFRLNASPATWMLGILNGVVLFVYNLAIINAALTGPFGFQSIFRLFGAVVVPLVFSLIFWGEALSVLCWAGIVLMLVSFVLINADGMALRDVKKGYIVWVMVLFLTNGIYSVIMAEQQRMVASMENNEMIVITFLSTAIISLISLAIRRKGSTLQAFSMNKKAWGSALGAGAVAALAVVQLMILLGRVKQISVFYTIENGMILVLTVVFSAILFKEKISRKAAVGIALSVISLALLSL